MSYFKINISKAELERRLISNYTQQGVESPEIIELQQFSRDCPFLFVYKLLRLLSKDGIDIRANRMAVILADKVLPSSPDEFYNSEIFQAKKQKLVMVLIRGIMFIDNIISSTCQTLIAKYFFLEKGENIDIIGMLLQIFTSDEYELQIRTSALLSFKKILEFCPMMNFDQYSSGFVEQLANIIVTPDVDIDLYKAVIETLIIAISTFHLCKEEETFQKYFTLAHDSIMNQQNENVIVPLYNLFSKLCTEQYIGIKPYVEGIVQVLDNSLSSKNKFHIFGAIYFQRDIAALEASYIMESNINMKPKVPCYQISATFCKLFSESLIAAMAMHESEDTCPEIIEDHICFTCTEIITNMLLIAPKKVSKRVIAYITGNTSSTQWNIHYSILLLFKAISAVKVSSEIQSLLSDFIASHLEYFVSLAMSDVSLLASQSIIAIKQLIKRYGVWIRDENSLNVILSIIEQQKIRDAMIECCSLVSMMAKYDYNVGRTLCAQIFYRSFKALIIYSSFDDDDLSNAVYKTISTMIICVPRKYHEDLENIKNSAISGLSNPLESPNSKLNYLRVIRAFAVAMYQPFLTDPASIIRFLFSVSITGESSTLDENVLSVISEIIIKSKNLFLQVNKDLPAFENIIGPDIIEKLVNDIKTIFSYDSPTSAIAAMNALSDLFRAFPNNQTLNSEKQGIYSALLQILTSPNSNIYSVSVAMGCLADMVKSSGVPEQAVVEILNIVVDQQFKNFSFDMTNDETIAESHEFIAECTYCIASCVAALETREVLENVYKLVLDSVNYFCKQEYYEFSGVKHFMDLIAAGAAKYQRIFARAVIKQKMRKLFSMWKEGVFLAKRNDNKKDLQNIVSDVYNLLLRS